MGNYRYICCCSQEVTGPFDFYGGRDANSGLLAYPSEAWTEAFALFRQPARWPDNLQPPSYDGFIGGNLSLWTSEDEGWRIDYEVYSPGVPQNTLCPWDSAEICYQVRNNVYEIVLGDDLLGDFGTWTEGTDGELSGDELNVAASPSDPSSTVEIVKPLTLPSMPANLNLPTLPGGGGSADEGYFLCKLKATVGDYDWIRVTFYDAAGTTDRHVWIDLSSQSFGGSSDANVRVDYVERLEEYWMRFVSDDSNTPQFGIRIVDGDGDNSLTSPTAGQGVTLTSCTLQWEELDNETPSDADEDYAPVGWDITQFECDDGSHDVGWRRFISGDSDLLLSDDANHVNMVVAASYSGFLGGLANRNSAGTADAGSSHSFLDSRGSRAGNCLPSQPIQVNPSEFLFYTGIGGTTGTNRPRTEAIVKIDGGGDTLYIGLAHTVNNDGPWWTYLEHNSHLPGNIGGVSGHVLIDDMTDPPNYYQSIGSVNDHDQIVRLAVMFGHSDDDGSDEQDVIEGIGFIPPRVTYWESDRNVGEDQNQDFYEARVVTDYCAITAGRCGIIPYTPGNFLSGTTGAFDPNGVVALLTEDDAVKVLQGPSGILWDDEKEVTRLAHFQTSTDFYGAEHGTRHVTDPDLSGDTGAVACNPIMGTRAYGGPTYAALFSHRRSDFSIDGSVPWLAWSSGGDPPTEDEVDQAYWLTLVIGEPSLTGGVGDNNVIREFAATDEDTNFDNLGRYMICGLAGLYPSITLGETMGGYTWFEEVFDPDDPFTVDTYNEGTVIAADHVRASNDGTILWRKRIPVYGRFTSTGRPDCVASSGNYMYITNWPEWQLEEAGDESGTVEIPFDTDFDGTPAELVFSSVNTYNADYIAVTVWIEHEHVGDLRVRLVAPDTTVIELANNKGGDANAFTATRFIQEAEDRLPSDNTGAPFTGNWLPDEIGAFNEIGGGIVTGDWKLQVIDTQLSGRADPANGTLTRFRIELGSVPQGRCWRVSHTISDNEYDYKALGSYDDGVNGRLGNAWDGGNGVTRWDTNKKLIELSPPLENPDG